MKSLTCRLTFAMAALILPGCGTTDDFRLTKRAYGGSEPTDGSRLLLPDADRRFSLLRREGDNALNLASSIPGSFAGRDAGVTGGLAAPILGGVLAVSVQDAADAAAERRVVVYTAALKCVVPEVDPAMARAKELALLLGGYVQRMDGEQITLRVPAERFEACLTQLEALGRIVHRDIQALDVTEEYVDLEARLKAAQQMRDRLAALLEKAADVKAMLEVERELGRVNEQIETLMGKLNVLKSKVAYSAITIQFERVAPRATSSAGARELPFRWLRELHPDRLWD